MRWRRPLPVRITIASVAPSRLVTPKRPRCAGGQPHPALTFSRFPRWMSAQDCVKLGARTSRSGHFLSVGNCGAARHDPDAIERGGLRARERSPVAVPHSPTFSSARNSSSCPHKAREQLCDGLRVEKIAPVSGSAAGVLSHLRRWRRGDAAPRHRHARRPDDAVQQEPPVIRETMHIVVEVGPAPHERAPAVRPLIGP